MSSKRIFEVCAFNIQSAIVAQNAGAARVELCDNPVEGGTTPSHGTIKATRERIDIALYPIIRPRAGNYLYDDEEFSIMYRDILVTRDLGCNGISVGIQKINGEVDTERLKRLVEWAGTMGVTCNRVFDCAPDPFKALEDIISCGCERILTSGLKSAAPDAADLLKNLVDAAGDRIIIMPGAGIKSSNVRKLAEQTNAREFHGSARKVANNPVTFLNKEVSDYGNVYMSDEEEVRMIIEQLNY
jgi:copper homeostasis protein